MSHLCFHYHKEMTEKVLNYNSPNFRYQVYVQASSG